MKNIYLQLQLSKYPLLEKRDIYKMLYQGAFGSGHMITDLDKALKYILEEAKGDTNDYDLYECISADFVRVNLHPYEMLGFDFAYLADAFAKSNKNGSLEKFKELVKEYDLPDYNYQAVHHSYEFSEKYHPHYRIMKKEFVTEQMKLALLDTYVLKNPDAPINIIGSCDLANLMRMKYARLLNFSNESRIIVVDEEGLNTESIDHVDLII